MKIGVALLLTLTALAVATPAYAAKMDTLTKVRDCPKQPPMLAAIKRCPGLPPMLVAPQR